MVGEQDAEGTLKALSVGDMVGELDAEGTLKALSVGDMVGELVVLAAGLGLYLGSFFDGGSFGGFFGLYLLLVGWPVG
jgi:hypothetical protein